MNCGITLRISTRIVTRESKVVGRIAVFLPARSWRPVSTKEAATRQRAEATMIQNGAVEASIADPTMIYPAAMTTMS